MQIGLATATVVADDPAKQAEWEAAGQAHDQHMHDTVDQALAEFHDAGDQLSGN